MLSLPVQTYLMILVGLVTRDQLEVIQYLQAENAVLREQLDAALHGKRPRFTQRQRRRLAECGRSSSRTRHFRPTHCADAKRLQAAEVPKQSEASACTRSQLVHNASVGTWLAQAGKALLAGQRSDLPSLLDDYGRML